LILFLLLSVLRFSFRTKLILFCTSSWRRIEMGKESKLRNRFNWARKHEITDAAHYFGFWNSYLHRDLLLINTYDLLEELFSFLTLFVISFLYKKDIYLY
jgi:hypothetical protein